MASKNYVCCICGDVDSGFGNNPDPISASPKDRACNFCDNMFVIPARLGARVTASTDLQQLAKALKDFGPDNVGKLIGIYQMLTAQPAKKEE